MEQNEKKNDMVEATDCLEAISVFKSVKNFLFIIILICLLLLQGIFWLEHIGYIDKSDSSWKDSWITWPESVPAQICPATLSVKPKLEQPPLEVVPEVPEKAETDEESIAKDAQLAIEELTEKTEKTDVPAEMPKTTATAAKKIELIELFTPKSRQVIAVIKACNFILIITFAMYVLTLLMSTKISLAGRLGGINHISRAFFRSLFGFVILLPWQQCFPGVIAGALYTPKELFCPLELTADPSWFGQAFYFLRFSILWAIVLLMLISAQLSSRKWSKATLRRLGIIQ